MLIKIVKKIRKKGLIWSFRRSMDLFSHTRENSIRENIGIASNILYSIYDCWLSGNSLRQSKIPPKHDEIKNSLLENGIKVIDYKINVSEFHKWREKYSFPESYRNTFKGIENEKLLEHYLSWKLLGLTDGDVFVDVAAHESPWYKIVQEIDHVNSYCLDLQYPKGIKDNKIGCNAADIPVPDGFFTKIALHCAFETFENDSDIEFIKEASRVLKDRGKLIILPLYMTNFHYISSSPFADRKGIKYGNAKLVYRDDGSMVRFARHYSADAFINRVYKYLNNLDLKIYFIKNEKEIDENCYIKFIAMFEKL